MDQSLFGIFFNTSVFASAMLVAFVFYWLKNARYERMEKKINSHVPTRFVALIAASNEEMGIERSILSLRKQKKIESVVVVLNNTNDSTPVILEKLQRKYGKWLVVLTMKRNLSKKSGALNYGLRYIDKKYGECRDDYIVLTLDADTIVGPRICREVAEVFKNNPHAGGANVQCLLQGLDTITNGERPRFMQRVWYAFQTVEYTLAMPQKISQHPKTRILAGACTALRLSALKDVCLSRRVAWRNKALVEDYDLTRTLHKLGWETPPVDVEAYTEVPLSAKTLYRQRRRWYSGTVTMLWGDLKKKFVWDDAVILLNVFLAPFLFLLQILIIALVIASSNLMLFICLPFFITAFAYSVQFVAFHKKRHGKSLLAWVVVLVPYVYLIYVMWNEMLYAASIVVSMKKIERSW